MEFDLSYVKRFFRSFYNIILFFVLVMAIYFVMSYYNRLSTVNNYVYDLQNELILLIGQDMRYNGFEGDVPSDDFYQKFNSGELKLISHIIVVNEKNEAFFASNPDKKYAFDGIQKNGDLRLGNLLLKDNLISSKRYSNGIEVMILSSNDVVRSMVFQEWIKGSRIQFVISILMPIIILILMMLVEDQLSKKLESKFLGYLQAIEDKSSESDELYHGLYLHNRSVMILIDPKTGLVVDGNEAAKAYYGYDFKKEEIRINQINTMPMEEINKIMADAIEKKRNFFNFQHRLANGMIRDVEVYSGPVRMKHETYLCSVVHDITDKMRAEQVLLNQQLQMEQKIKEKTEVLGIISHEIKTPIAGIIHNVNDLETHIEDEALLKQLQFLKFNVNNLNRLVFDLLDYSRIDAGGFKFYSTQFDLLDVLEASRLLFEPIAREKEIQLSIDSTQLRRNRYVGDAFRIGQIINNLISNSVKYTHKGSIGIKVMDEAMDHQSLVTIQIEDTGIGMKQEVVDHIFKSYFTTDSTGAYGGTGLGLSICRHIVEAMSGTLEVSSEENVGTKMTLIFELDNDEGADLNLMNFTQVDHSKDTRTHLKLNGFINQEKTSEGEIRILIVDDDPMSCLFIEKMLKQVNFLDVNVDCAYNGKEALQLLEVNHYKGFFIDYRLPDFYGLELAEVVSNRNKGKFDAKIVLMSAEYIQTDAKHIDAFLLKPIEIKDIDRLIRQFWMGRKCLLNSNLQGEGRLIKRYELEALMDFIGEDEFVNIVRVFSKTISEKYAALPEVLTNEKLKEVQKLLHSIKGSISYFKSEDYAKVLHHFENALNEEHSMLELNLDYLEFYRVTGEFIEELKQLETDIECNDYPIY